MGTVVFYSYTTVYNTHCPILQPECNLTYPENQANFILLYYYKMSPPNAQQSTMPIAQPCMQPNLEAFLKYSRWSNVSDLVENNHCQF